MTTRWQKTQYAYTEDTKQRMKKFNTKEQD